MRFAGPSWFKLFFLGCLLAASPWLPAQGVDPSAGNFSWPQGGSMPVWVVPVLRLVSSTHVEPTTGVVLATSGLVLVPADFASPGDEIVVLDGGTDIVRNGRRARIEKRYSDLGLEVLAVEGLSRRPASLAARLPENGARVRLVAFPPAESIAKGEAPLKTPAALTVFPENGHAAISAQTPLPNVTGPLLDRCGDLLAMSVADSPQTMNPSPATRYLWLGDLASIFADLGVTPTPSACQGVAETAAQVAPAEPQASVTEPPPQKPAEQEEQTPPPEPATAAGPEPESPQPGAADIGLTELPPFEHDESAAPTPPEPPTARPARAWLVAALVLFALGAAVHVLRTRSRRRAAATATEAANGTPGMAENGSGRGPGATRFDTMLLLRGSLADGQAIEAACPVSEKAVNVVIGRQDADLTIDSDGVSRQHARLNGSRDGLTLSDLGSRNGSAVNGVPCLEGEIVFVEPGDVVTLGDVRLTIEFAPLGKGGGRK